MLTFFVKVNNGFAGILHVISNSKHDLLRWILPGFKAWMGWLGYIYANLVILATPVLVVGHQVVSLGHLGGFVAF